MKAIPTIVAAVLVLGTIPAAAESESEAEERKAKHEEARTALLDELGLEGDQRSQVEEILKAHGDSSKEVADEHHGSRRQAWKQRRALRKETEGKLKEVLSEEQFTRLQELRKERRKEHGGDHHREGVSRGGEERSGGKGRGGGRGQRGRSHH